MPPRYLCQNDVLNVNDCYLFVLYFVTDGTLIFVRGNVQMLVIAIYLSTLFVQMAPWFLSERLFTNTSWI